MVATNPLAKRCYRCKTEKSLAEFSRHSGRPDGFRAECKPCAQAERRAWYARNRDKVRVHVRRKWREDLSASRAAMRKRVFRRNHGIEVAEADALIVTQANLCALCGEVMGPRGSGKYGAVLDHNHKTGVQRAMLHSNCNCLLGFAGDSTVILHKAIAYLGVHSD